MQKINLIYVIEIEFFGEVLARLLPSLQHVKINGAEHPDHSPEDHDNSVVRKEYLFVSNEGHQT